MGEFDDVLSKIDKLQNRSAVVGKQRKTEEIRKSNNVIKDLIRLELKIKTSLVSLKTIPRNESLNKAFKSSFKVLNEQSVANWENFLRNIPAYENALQKIIETEDDFDIDYLHNNLNKLLTNASDIRELYNDTVAYIKRRSNEPEFENAYSMTKSLVNKLLAAVRDLVELDEAFVRVMERNNVNYIEKYKLYDVD